ncbi:MAG TPA: LysM domain-containing protein [Gemmatimonadaceae bacterium]|nr:LysM domain-containing protein [Gemmatimonadaceae bacterium]
MRNRTLRTVLAAASIAAAPTVLAAQQPAPGNAVPQTHTVVAGETLWSLAQRYLSDPYRWHEIYDLNKGQIADPHWIYPGQVLKLPGTVTGVSVSVTPMPAAPDTGAEPAPAPGPVRGADWMSEPTVFHRPTPRAPGPESLGEDETAMPTVNQGEYVRAPYVMKAADVPGAGRIIKSGDLDPDAEPLPTTIFKAYDNVLIVPPAGVTPKKGDRYVALTMDDVLRGQGQVVVPTGVVQVTRPPEGGAAAVAMVVQIFGEMHPDQILVPLDTAGVSSTVRPKAVTGGRSASIRWILASPVLPTMQNYAVLDLTSADGVKPGDVFDVFRTRTAASHVGDPADPEIPIARAQAIKVTPYGTTVLIVAQQQPAIDVGMMARMSAKMP